MSDEISQGLGGTDGDNSPVGDSNSSEISESPESTFGDLPELGDNGQPQDTANGASKGHPAWDEYLKDIPEQFRPQVTPAFEKWDKDFQKVQSRFAPYEKFTQHQPEELEAAMQVAQYLRTNPRALYDNLAERFGFNNADEDQGQSEEEDDLFGFDDNSDKDDSIENNPRFREVTEQLQAMQQFIQQQAEQQQQAEITAQAQRETEESFAHIEKSINRNLSNAEKSEIIKRTVMIGDANGGKNYDLIEGYKDFAKFANSIRNQPSKNDTAPAVLSGSGGLPVKNKDDLSFDQKFDGYAAQIAALNKQQ